MSMRDIAVEAPAWCAARGRWWRRGDGLHVAVAAKCSFSLHGGDPRPERLAPWDYAPARAEVDLSVLRPPGARLHLSLRRGETTLFEGEIGELPMIAPADAATLPIELDARAYQRAPSAQRAIAVQAGDIVALARGGAPPLTSRLPEVRLALRAHGGEVDMTIDSLAFDADAGRAIVTWRAAIAVGRGALPALSVVAREGATVLATPATAPAAAPAAAPAPGAPTRAERFAATVAMSIDDQTLAGLSRGVPFQRGSSQALPPSTAAPTPPGSAPENPLERTVAVEVSERPGDLPFSRRTQPLAAVGTPASSSALPWPGAPPAPSPSPPAPAPRPPSPPATSSPGAGATTPRASRTPIDIPARERSNPRVPIFFGATGVPDVDAPGDEPSQPIVAFTLPWQLQPPQPSLTVIAKATFDLVPGAPMALRRVSDPPRGEMPFEGPGGSATYPSDFAPAKRRVDVTLAGHAYALDAPVRQMEARLQLGEPPNAIDRRLAVIGDRLWQAGALGARPGAPEPFTSMPVCYERSFGGPRTKANPVGRGDTPAPGAPLPNLEDPNELVTGARQSPAPACFAPIALEWPARWSLIGSYGGDYLATRWPYFAADLDPAMWNAAPREQQLDHLRGNERYALTNLHPAHARLEGRLPGLRVRCFKLPAGGSTTLEEVPLRIDTIHFDSDAGTAQLVWRATIRVADDDARDVAALLLFGEPLDATPASEADAYEWLRAAVTAKPAEPESGEPVASTDAEVAPPAASDIDAELADEDERLRQVMKERGMPQAQIDALLAAAPANDPPPSPDPDELRGQLAAAGMSQAEIDRLLAAMVEARRPLEPEAEEAEPDVRATVQAALAAGHSLADRDLSGADLSHLDLSGACLARTSLAGADLTGAKLDRADLSLAQLHGANLADASLEGAALAFADLTGASLHGARFTGARIDCAELSGAKGIGASFERATGAGASFAGCQLEDARLEQASLPRADFSNAILDGCRFDGATLPEVRLHHARGRGCSFAGAEMSGARGDHAELLEASFEGARAQGSVWNDALLDGAIFRGALLEQASFLGASCLRADLSGAELSGARFDRAACTRARFAKSNLKDASFQHADLAEADLRHANLYGSSAWKARWSGALLEGALMAKSTFEEGA